MWLWWLGAVTDTMDGGAGLVGVNRGWDGGTVFPDFIERKE